MRLIASCVNLTGYRRQGYAGCTSSLKALPCQVVKKYITMGTTYT
jgi:hypothetical protein